MPDRLRIRIDGVDHEVEPGVSVAAALWNTGLRAFRRTSDGRARAPLCGMGTCFECRVTIDGHPDRRSCQTPCRQGMQVETGDAT